MFSATGTQMGGGKSTRQLSIIFVSVSIIMTDSFYALPSSFYHRILSVYIYIYLFHFLSNEILPP